MTPREGKGAGGAVYAFAEKDEELAGGMLLLSLSSLVYIYICIWLFIVTAVISNRGFL